jgi:hypothetical protein
MGMSASQARFLCLTARKTNTEYEGQQINQQRTALSNESSNYYSQLTSMNVPTPPSSADYTKITYTFKNGTETNTITSLIATEQTAAQGIYKINYTQEYPEDTMVVSGASQITKTGSQYFIGADEVVTGYLAADVASASADDIRNHLKASGVPENVVNTMTENELKAKATVEAQYHDMMIEKYGDPTKATTAQFRVIYRQAADNQSYEPVFFSQAEIDRFDYDQKTGLSLGGLKTYEFGQAPHIREIKNKEAKVEQDSSGRYISVFIYDKDSTDGAGTRYELTTTTVADERGYNDAMNQYYFDKAVYDAKVQEINAKIEIIQTQDKNLELKLKQLDTEENAISTELDAVKKVISKNVESSFKTFNA